MDTSTTCELETIQKLTEEVNRLRSILAEQEKAKQEYYAELEAEYFGKVPEANKIEPGIYLETDEIPDTETWKKVIDALVEAGAQHFEGYGPNCVYDHSEIWRDWDYVGVDQQLRICHADHVGIYSEEGVCDLYPATLTFVLEKGKL